MRLRLIMPRSACILRWIIDAMAFVGTICLGAATLAKKGVVAMGMIINAIRLVCVGLGSALAGKSGLLRDGAEVAAL